MNATEAKRIVSEAFLESTNNWWYGNETRIFEIIKDAAKQGDWGIVLGVDSLGIEGYKPEVKDKVITRFIHELCARGYAASSFCVVSMMFVKISWNI